MGVKRIVSAQYGLLTLLLTGTTSCLLRLLTLVFFVQCSWGPLGFLPVIISMFETWHLDKSFSLDTSLNSTIAEKKCMLQEKVCFPTHMGEVWSFHGCLHRYKSNYICFPLFSLTQLSHIHCSPQTHIWVYCYWQQLEILVKGFGENGRTNVSAFSSLSVADSHDIGSVSEHNRSPAVFWTRTKCVNNLTIFTENNRDAGKKRGSLSPL